MRRCRHGGEALRRARALRAKGQFAAALDYYLEVVADHPVETTNCRRPILMEAACLAYSLDCGMLAYALANAAYSEAVLGRTEAPALLIMALVAARRGAGEQADLHLAKARASARWTRSLRRQVHLAERVVDILADSPDRLFDSSVPLRGKGLERALARLAYASALQQKLRNDEAAEQFAKANDEFERLAPIRRLRRHGVVVSDGFQAGLAELGWALTVAELTPIAPDARLAAMTLVARGATYRAMRLSKDLSAEDRRNPSLCWYVDLEFVRGWSELLEGDSGRGWLTGEDAEHLVSRLVDVFGRLHATDPACFPEADRLAARTLAMYGDRIGSPSLALDASRAELQIARSRVGTEHELDWKQMAWVLRRQAVCMADAGLVDGRISLLAEASELYRENSTSEDSRDEVRQLGDQIVGICVDENDWTAAIAATVRAQRQVAAMAGEDSLPSIASALGFLYLRSLHDAPADVSRRIVTERTEILRILAGRDPGMFAFDYGNHLLKEMRKQPPDEGAAHEAIAVARGLVVDLRDQHALLGVQLFHQAAINRLPDGAEAALAMLDEAIASLRVSTYGVAEAHRVRAECLRLRGREAEHLDALQLEANTRLAYPESDGWFARLLAIEGRLWNAGRIEASIALLDRAIEIAGDGGYGGGTLRLRRAGRASRLMRERDALKDLAAIAEGPPLVASQCGASYALVHWRAQRREEAILALDEAIAAPEHSLAPSAEQHYALYLRGVLRTKLNHIRPALDDLLAAAKLRPEEWATRAVLSETYLLLGENDAAVREGHLAVDLQPDEPHCHAAFGLALLASGYRAEAFNELDRAVSGFRAEPNQVARQGALLSVPRLLVARGDVPAAFRAMREAIAVEPPPYLVWETSTDLLQLSRAVPEIAEGCTSVRDVLGVSPK